MLERMGRARYAAPAVMALVIACVMGVLFYPMLHMEMKGLPFAVLSLDEGAQTPQGEVNAGGAMVEKLTQASGDDAPMTWAQVSSQEELDEAFANDKYYGALVIPADYTQATVAAKLAAAGSGAQAQAGSSSQEGSGALAALAAQTGSDASAGSGSQAGSDASAGSGAQTGSDASAALAAQAGTQADSDAQASGSADAPALTMIIDNAKSPLVAQQLKTSAAAIFQQLGATVDVQVINQGSSSGTSSALPTSAMMGQQIAIMPTCTIALVSAVLVSTVLLPMRGSAASRWRTLGLQVALIACVAVVVALCSLALETLAVGTDVDAWTWLAFTALSFFCVALALVGAFDVAKPLGALAALCMFALAMLTGVMPTEALPAFWRDWVVPWAPQHYMGLGIREILYRGAGAWIAGSLPLVITGCAGLVLMALGAVVPRRERP